MKKILFVDDDETSQDVVRFYVENYYEIDVASTPNEALELVSKNKYDVILMDIGLGYKTNGIQLTQKIRNRYPYYKNIPVVAVTAFATSTDEANAYEGGLDYFIVKPFSKTSLLNLLEKITKEK